MATPKMTKADADIIPRCPHCEASLSYAQVTVEDLLDHYPFRGWIAVYGDGYATEGEHLTTHCPSCLKPVALGFNANDEPWDWQLKCVAARTKADRRFRGDANE